MAASHTDFMAPTTAATQRRRRRGAARPVPAVADWTRAGLFGKLSGVDRIFTLEQARLLMPDLLARRASRGQGARSAAKREPRLVQRRRAGPEGHRAAAPGLPRPAERGRCAAVLAGR